MKIEEISSVQIDTLRRAAEYILGCWDWESPTLFGLSKEEFGAACIAKLNTVEAEAAFIRVGHSSLNEMLNGARALSSEQIEATLGVTSAQASALSNEISSLFPGEF